MGTSSIVAYQKQLAARLGKLFEVETATEWRTMAGEPGLYSPRLDVAVGPFATGELQCGADFDRLVERHDGFLRRLFEAHEQNLLGIAENIEHFAFEQVVTRNWNARCLLAIEIENVGSRKHLMGGAINAAAVGRIGIAVGWNKGAVRAFVRLRSYLLFLARVGKNTFDPINLLVVDRDQLMETVTAVKRARRRRKS